MQTAEDHRPRADEPEGNSGPYTSVVAATTSPLRLVTLPCPYLRCRTILAARAAPHSNTAPRHRDHNTVQPDARLSLDQRGSDTVFCSATHDANAAAAAAQYMHNSIRFLLKPLACRDFIDEYDAVHPESRLQNTTRKKRNSACSRPQHLSLRQYLRHQRAPAPARVQPIPNNDQLTRLASRRKTALASRSIPGGDDEARRHNSPSPARNVRTTLRPSTRTRRSECLPRPLYPGPCTAAASLISFETRGLSGLLLSQLSAEKRQLFLRKDVAHSQQSGFKRLFLVSKIQHPGR
ncbi:hypothetical protein B0H14DRAFT_2709032 [Mycena olivaceomarginata]|nr:hypothetical protein B0H14DRAFT_2709032 [Mycena olivaceomarginata]